MSVRVEKLPPLGLYYSAVDSYSAVDYSAVDSLTLFMVVFSPFLPASSKCALRAHHTLSVQPCLFCREQILRRHGAG